MPAFAVQSGRDDATDLQDFAGGAAPAAPPSFWSSVSAGFSDATQVHNLGAREEQWRDALWQRDRQIEAATGTKLPLSTTMAGSLTRYNGDIGQAALAGVQFQSDQDHEAAIDALRKTHPQAMAGVPTLDQLKASTAARLNQIEQAAAVGGQAHPIGAFLGGAGGGLFDPVNAALLPFGGGGEVGDIGAVGLRTVAGQVLKRAAMQSGVQAGAAALSAPFRALEAQDIGGPAYGFNEALGDVAGAAVGGGLFELGLSPLHIAGAHLGAALEADPAARGAASALDVAARDSAAVGPLRSGQDFDAGLNSLDQWSARPPKIEPAKNLENLFGDGPISPVELPKLNEAEQGDLQPGDVLAKAEYRGRPIYAASLDPRQTGAAPDLFQYKSGGDDAGVTQRLLGVKAWDPVSSGKALFWQDGEGKVFVADGHQRRGLALRLEQRGFEPKLDGYLFRSADGWSPAEVRILAALKNIREGQGATLDAAKVFREAPGAMNDDSLPVSGEFIHQAKALARLDPEAFGAVVNGVIPERFGSAIGEGAADRPDLHMDMVRLLKAGDPQSLDEARAMIQEAKTDDWLKHEPDQQDLFGDAPRQSVVIAKARLNAAVLKVLRADARAFSGVVKNADALEAGGNALARDANEAELAVSQAALEVISKLGLRSGEIGYMMTEAAKRILDGEAPAVAAKSIARSVKHAIAAGERLDELRKATLDPDPPPAASVEALKAFDEPGGKGQAEQLAPKPEDAALEAEPDEEALANPLFADLEPVGAHKAALDRLKPCAPGE